MQILIPTHAFTNNPKSGLHSVIWNVSKHLACLGHTVHVVTTFCQLDKKTKGELEKMGLHIHKCGKYPMHNLTKPLALRCFLTALRLRLFIKFDWIFILDTSKTPFHRFKLGAKIATRALAPENEIVHELLTTGDWRFDRDRKNSEEGWEERRISIWYRAFCVFSEMWFACFPVKHHVDNVDLLFCQGRETLEYWEKHTNVPCTYMPNGVDINSFISIKPPKRNTNRFIFLFVGRIAKRKGIFYLTKAFNKLREKYEDIELWIVGKGSSELCKQLQNDVDKDDEHIYYFGEIERDQVPAFFQNCSVLVDPMIYQGFSSVCLEAMCCGKPVIASKYGGTKDFVRDNQEGFLVDPRDEESLFQKMHWMISNPQKAKEMGNFGKKLVQSTYTWDKVIRKVETDLQDYL
ncbi:glycosyltransferase family 4 protein [Patescibacteria group bacterium]|nr:glycosyltransferase family 4 protein [Patescibacteria group bacterium]